MRKSSNTDFESIFFFCLFITIEFSFVIEMNNVTMFAWLNLDLGKDVLDFISKTCSL